MLKTTIAAAMISLAMSTVASAQTVQPITALDHLLTFQLKMSASPIPFPLLPARNGLTCTAKAGNAAPIEIGGTSSVAATVDGTGTGLILAAGTSAVIAVNGQLATGQTAQAWAIGTSNDVLSCVGN